MTDLFRLPRTGRASAQGPDRNADWETDRAEDHGLNGRPDADPDEGCGRGQTAMTPLECLWEVSVRPEDANDPAYRSRLLGHVRSGLEAKLRDDPAARDLTWRTPLGTVEAHLHGDRTQTGGPIRLAFAKAGDAGAGARAVSNRLAPPVRQGNPDPDEALPCLRLPDEPTRQLGNRLVGLEDARRGILQRWESRWDGALDAWARKTGSPLPLALREHLNEGHELWLLSGDPGTGKSALARCAADAYCRRQGVGGTVLWLGTAARGQGLVGDSGRRLRAAFRQLRALPGDELKVLLVDEADAVAMRRSEGQAHQEDRAATSTLIQALDEAAGTRRLSVMMTSNTAGNVDAAIQRRARLIAFGRPNTPARRALLARWLPHLSASELDAAAVASDAMTPADIERAVAEAWLAAVGADMPLTATGAVSALRQAERTGSV